MLSSRSRRQMPYWHAMVPVGLQVSRSSMNLVLTTYRETDVLATCRFHFSVPPRFDSCFLSHSVDASFRARDLGAWCDVFGAPIGVSLSLSIPTQDSHYLPSNAVLCQRNTFVALRTILPSSFTTFCLSTRAKTRS